MLYIKIFFHYVHVLNFILLPIATGIDSGILNKFHQTDYQIKYERWDGVRFDENYFSKFQAVTYKLNRSHAVTNWTWQFKVDVDHDLLALIQVHKFISNEYREFPIHFQDNFCSFLDHNVLGFQNYINDQFRCPFKKNVEYKINMFYPDQRYLPPFIPSGQFMVDIVTVHLKQEIAETRFYVTVYRPITAK